MAFLKENEVDYCCNSFLLAPYPCLIINTFIPGGWTNLRTNGGGAHLKLACATDETKHWLSPSAKQRRNPCSGPASVYQDLSTHHYWPFENAG